MKTIHKLLVLTAVAASLSTLNAQQPADAPAKTDTNAAAAPGQPADAAPPTAAPTTPAPSAPPDATAPAAPALEVRTDGLITMNFHNASLETVLNHMSTAAGYIINLKPGTSVRGKVDVWSSHPLTKDEAFNLLQTVLRQNNLAAIRNERTLSIVPLDEAKINGVPVVLQKDPNKIPKTDEVATYIIPVQFVEVGQLIKDLQPLVSSQNTTMTANESGNAIVITDTQANIHRVAEIISDIDAGAQSFTELRVFKLVNADANETADLLSSLFPDDSRSGGGGGSSSPFSRFASRFGGFGGFGGGGGPPGLGGPPGGGGQGGNNSGDQRVRKRARVIAIADQRTHSVVVSAAKELMEQVEGVIKDLDQDSAGHMVAATIAVENTDLQQLNQVLTDLFNKNTTTQNRNQNNANLQSTLSTRNSPQNNQSTSSGRNNSGLGSSSRSGGSSSLLQP